MSTYYSTMINSRSGERIFRCPLQFQINMNLVFHISEDGSEIEMNLPWFDFDCQPLSS